jgi:hypothetical protein
MFAHVSEKVKEDLGCCDHRAVRRLLACAAFATLALTACGDTTDVRIQERTIPGDADAKAIAVVDEWAMALSAGDLTRAASYFAIPSVAENGPSVIRIRNRSDALLFNESLPCGAELLRAEEEGGQVTATFRLGERPGPGTCGSGAGARAKTSFRIEEGKITIWQRVPTAGESAPPVPSDVV